MPKTDTEHLLREIKTLIGDGDRDGVPDGQLLTQFVDQRDETAFELLVRRYGRLVFGVCRRVLADPHSAEDAFQATFLVLVHKAPSLDRRRPVGDWLYTVAFRLACRARANAARRREKESHAARNHITDEPTTDDTPRIVHEELNRLPEQHRIPLVLSYLEGRTYEQVARALGCPLGSVSHRLNRAKEVLRDRLTSRGIVCPAAGIAALLTAAASHAAVPIPVFDATVRAGLWFAGERAIGAAVASAAALQLARGAMGTMTANKLTVAAGVLLALGLGGGTVWMARSSAMADPQDAPAVKADPAPAAKPAELPPGVTARLGSTQFRHGEAVFFIAYTPDGKHLVTAGHDHAIILWDRATGLEVRRFERAVKKQPLDPKAAAPMEMAMPRMMRPEFDFFPVALSPDGKTLAAGRESTITVWDVANGKKQHELTATAQVFELVFTPDGQSLVSADMNNGVALWDPTTGKQQKTVQVKKPDQPGTVVRAGSAVSPTGTHFVEQLLDMQNGNGTLRVHDLATGQAKPDINLETRASQNVAFSADGKYLAWSSYTDGITVWDITTNKQVARFGGAEGMKRRFFGQSLRFSNDNKMLAVTLANDAIELWDVENQKLIRTIGGHEAARGNGVVVKFVLASGGRMTRSDLTFSSDGKTIAASFGHATVRQFDTGSGNEAPVTAGHLSGVIATGSDGRSVVSVSKESVRVWDTTGRELRQWPLTPPAIAAVVSPDAKRVATSSGGGVVQVWDAATGQKLRDIQTNRSDVAGIGFSPDDKLIATKADLTAAVNLWDVATGRHIRTIGQDSDNGRQAGFITIQSNGVQTPVVVFSPDGRLVAAGGDRHQVCVWDVATGMLVSEFPVSNLPSIAAIAFSGNGHVLATLSSNGVVTGYELATGEKRFEFKTPTTSPDPFGPEPGLKVMSLNMLGRGNANAGAIGFTPDGRFILAATGNSTIRAWDTQTGQEAAQLKGHTGIVSSLQVAVNGRSLVSGSVDTTALVWDLTRLPRVELTRATPLPAAELDAAWADLAKTDPVTAFTATRKLLTDRKQTVAMLKDRVRPMPAVEDARIAKLVADLSGTFDARRKATAELEQLGDLAVPHLRKAIEGNPPLDLKQRVERLLEKAAVRKLEGDPLRALRAVELLELAATPEAKQVLESLAKGAPGARLTHEAEAALARLNAGK